MEALLYDPQTSGGLLISLAEAEAVALLDELPEAYVIGWVTERGSKPLEVNG
jgi:selenophosphate synthase